MSICSESITDQERYTDLIGMLRPDHPFVQLGFHFGPKAGPTSRTTRVKRGGKYFIKKEYLGQLSNKTEQEIGLLMAAAWKGLQHTASFKTVNAMTCNVSEASGCADGNPTLELLMKNYGLDLEDWFFLLREASVDYLNSPYFYLALMHHILSAMKELHEANFVQVDVKSDNICVALPRMLDASTSPNRIRLEFNLKELTLIDLGEALHPDANKRVLLFHQNGMALGPGNDYISRNYKQRKALVKQNEMNPIRSLDWRVDFYALGCMLEDWLMYTQFPTLAPGYLSVDEKRTYVEAIQFLHTMPARLKSEDTDPAIEATNLPHAGIIKQIGRMFNLEKWSTLEFSLPVDIQSDITSAVQAKHPFAKETLLVSDSKAASEVLNTKQKDIALPESFVQAEGINKNSNFAKSDLDALSWYLKASQQGGRPQSGIDLMC